MIKGLEHLLYEERLRARTVQPRGEGSGVILSMCINTSQEGGYGEDGARLYSVVPTETHQIPFEDKSNHL